MFLNDAKWRYKMHRRFGKTAFFRVARRITSSLFVVVCHYENVNWPENFTEFSLKASSKPLKSIKCFFSNVKRS